MGGADDGTSDVLGRRVDVLRAIEDGPSRKCRLVERLEASRSTVDRAIRELERHGLVERTDGEFAATTAGRLALTEYDRFVDRLRGLTESQPALSELADDPAVDPAIFEDATVTLPERTDPRAPVRRLGRLIEASDTHLVCTPGVLPDLVDRHRRRIAEGGMAARFVLRDCVVERLLSDYEEALRTAVETDRVEVRVTDAAFRHGLVLSRNDDRTVAAVAVYVESGLRGLIASEADAAVEWAESEFERRWERARPLRVEVA